jgi:rubrerythrin
VGGGDDYIICSNCLAKWHVWIGKSTYNLGRVRWAKLITDGSDKRGTELLGKEIEPAFWQEMAIKRRKEMPKMEGQNTNATVREKETIREIVKVRCRYCGALCLETLDKCPYCGASL